MKKMNAMKDMKNAGKPRVEPTHDIHTTTGSPRDSAALKEARKQSLQLAEQALQQGAVLPKGKREVL